MDKGELLDSWKEISAYLNRNIRTCQTWERELGLPVHRLNGSPRAHVFAYSGELDAWRDEKGHLGHEGEAGDDRQQAAGIGEAQPYPGLASFGEADAEYFFGREAEVEEVWERLPHRPLLALIGIPGAGKSSFLRAGLIPAKPEGWAHLVCTPGQAPFVALGQALVTEVARDTDAMRQMLRFEDADVAVNLFRRWRDEHAGALVIVDQFEELFTLNPPDVQGRFASLLSRLGLEADVHVLLSMRDDFLMRCQAYEALGPVFSGLVPLGPPAGEALRRALVQPALKCGCRFEDEALVDEMLRAVEGERGALPLLAFAAASLWHSRDRETGLLTHAVLDAAGGVAGALTRHAEATLERIGTAKLPLAREIFRNLVTAQGTRAVRDAEELLSVFHDGQRADAEAVLQDLIDARLLTSYEAPATGPGRAAGRSIELVHESLLTAWPRLVRWRTEDEGGAQLRDQVRQAARLWEEKGKPADLLWSGTSYQEYQVWRARYPGGLSDGEEAFGRAMAQRAGRRRRRRRAVYAAALAAVVLTAAGLGILLRRSVLEKRRAESESSLREGEELLALGRLRLADYPNAALAYAIASLERSDNGPARRFAVEALWQGPPAIFLKDRIIYVSYFKWSGDGRWLAFNDAQGLALFEKGRNERRSLSSSREEISGFTSDGQRLLTYASPGGLGVIRPGIINVRTLPEGRLDHTVTYSPADATVVLLSDDRLMTISNGPASAAEPEKPKLFRRLSPDGKFQEVVGLWSPHGLKGFALDPGCTSIFSIQGGRVLQQSLDALSAPPRVLGRHEGDVMIGARPWVDQAVTCDVSGEVRIWNVPSARLERTLKSPADARGFALDPRGRFLATTPGFVFVTPRSMFLFDLTMPRTAEPVPLLYPDSNLIPFQGFSPDGSWFFSERGSVAILWNLSGPRSAVVGRQKLSDGTVAFTRDGHLLSASDEGALRSWPLSPTTTETVRELLPPKLDAALAIMGVDPGGRFVVAARYRFGPVLVVPLDGSPPRALPLQRPGEGQISCGMSSLDPNGRFLAVWTPYVGKPERNGVRILDLVTGAVRVLDTHAKGGDDPSDDDLAKGRASPLWLRDGRLVTDGEAGFRVWDLAAGTSRLLGPGAKGGVALVTADSRSIVRFEYMRPGSPSRLSVFDLATGVSREITRHGDKLNALALDPSGTVLVTADNDGVMRAGPLTGEEPYLLYGHTGPVQSVAVSPDGRWIASIGDDETVRMWPMPDMTKPPLHALPYGELMAKLHSLTNLRAVRDPSSDTGWKIEIGPFPGWMDAPKW